MASRFASKEECLQTIAYSGVGAFAYDRETQEFLVAGKRLPLHDQVLADVDEVLYNAPPLEVQDLARLPLVRRSVGDTIVLPQMQAAFATITKAKKAAASARRVMHETLGNLTNGSFGPDMFDCFLPPLDGVQFPQFRVLGESSLHPMAEGFVGEDGWEYDIANMNTNNAELPEWEVTLCAGLGHLAQIATNLSQP